MLQEDETPIAVVIGERAEWLGTQRDLRVKFQSSVEQAVTDLRPAGRQEQEAAEGTEQRAGGDRRAGRHVGADGMSVSQGARRVRHHAHHWCKQVASCARRRQLASAGTRNSPDFQPFWRILRGTGEPPARQSWRIRRVNRLQTCCGIEHGRGSRGLAEMRKCGNAECRERWLEAVGIGAGATAVGLAWEPVVSCVFVPRRPTRTMWAGSSIGRAADSYSAG